MSGSGQGTLKIWHATDGRLVRTLEGHQNVISGVTVLSNGFILSGSYDETMKMWRAANGNCVKTLTGHNTRILCLDELPDGRIVSGDTRGTIKVWEDFFRKRGKRMALQVGRQRAPFDIVGVIQKFL